MNDLYRGTSAYKLEAYESYTRKSTQDARERRIQAKLEQRAFCRVLIISVLLMFVACSSFIYVNVMALRASSKIDELEKELALVIDENKQKEIKINQNLDMKVIEKKAIEKLGMQKPDNSQIVYINVKKAMHSEAVNAPKKSAPAFSGIKEVLVSIAEYFS